MPGPDPAAPTDIAAETISGGVGPMLPGAAREARPLRQQILEHVRAAGRAARADISRALNVSAGSVTTLTSELIGLGLRREVEAPAPATGRGRPPVALEVVPEGRLVIGIKLSDERNSAVLTDFAGNMLADATLPTPPIRRTLEQTCDDVAALVDALLVQCGRARSEVLAVGIGLSGLVDHDSGSVLWSPHLAGSDLPLGAAVEARIGMPTLVDNDANMLTLAELWFGAGRERSDFVVVTIEHGVGMGMVIDNRLYRGTRGMGLELGHIKVHLDGALCRCGKRGCLEAYVADYAMAREAATALGRNPRNQQNPQTMLDALYAEAKAGNQAARTIFRRAGRYLSLGLSNVLQLFDPELIILSGERMQYDYLYANEMLAEMQALALSDGRSPATVEIHAWGDLVWARGATAMALASVTGSVLAEARGA